MLAALETCTAQCTSSMHMWAFRQHLVFLSLLGLARNKSFSLFASDHLSQKHAFRLLLFPGTLRDFGDQLPGSKCM